MSQPGAPRRTQVLTATAPRPAVARPTVAPRPAATGAPATAAPAPGTVTVSVAPQKVAAGTPNWTNPAAAAALRSSIDLLKGSEDGIIRNYQDPERARVFSAEVASSGDITSVAQQAVLSDASKENDQFVPLIDRASGYIGVASTALANKDLAANWPSARMDIVTAIRQARMISENVAKQLDPTLGTAAAFARR